MNKAEYIAALRREIQALPEAEREEAIKYYSDYFDDAGTEKEAEVMSELGTPQELAQFILSNFACVPEPTSKGRGDTDSDAPNKSVNQSVARPTTSETQSSAARIVLLILLVVITFPIWCPVVATVGGILFGVFVAIIAVGAALVIAAAAVLLAGVALVAFGIGTMFGAPLSALLLSGSGLMLTGAGIICIIAGAWVCSKIIPAIIRGVVKLCRMPFNGKEKSA